jgi:hypothetical protein
MHEVWMCLDQIFKKNLNFIQKRNFWPVNDEYLGKLFAGSALTLKFVKTNLIANMERN